MYRLQVTAAFEKQFRKLDKSVQRLIKSWIDKNLNDTEDPRKHGKALVGNLSGYWRYRIGDYRLITEIRDQELIVVAITIGHRSKIYE